jgi:Flp pilus assembly protein TadD
MQASSSRSALFGLVLSLALPGFALAEGSGPSGPPPPMPSTPAVQPQSPEEKALEDRRQAEDLYNSAYKDVDKAKAELAEAESLSAAGDAKLADKAKKKSESATKRFQKSVDKFQRATQLAPDYHEAWNMLGFCLRKSGDTQKAMQAYWECLRLKPDYVPAHEYLGEAYLEAGNLEKAQAELAWLKDRDPALAAQLDKKIQKFAEIQNAAKTPSGSN